MRNTFVSRPLMPAEIYRRPLTNVYYTREGQVFCHCFDPRLKQYQYAAATFDQHGEVGIWRQRPVDHAADIPADYPRGKRVLFKS